MTASADRDLRRRQLVTIGVATAAFGAVGVAAAGGTVPFAVEGPRATSTETPTEEVSRPRPTIELPVLPVPDPQDSVGADITGAIAHIAVVLVVAALIFFVGRSVKQVLRLSGRSRVQPPETEVAPPTGTGRVQDAVDDSLDELSSGPVDDVVVACWVRLEEVAAAGGEARRPSDTSADLAVRMLAGLHAPDAAVDRLLGLYRTARYSSHRLGERDRADAIAALAEIRHAIGLVST